MKLLTAIIILAVMSGIYAQQQDTLKDNKQFIYVLKLTEKYQKESNWDDQANQTIAVHFKHLQDMLAEGRLILAGRTETPLDQTLGICIFTAGSMEEAQETANNDPAVKAGIMTVEVFPYKVALMRGGNEK